MPSLLGLLNAALAVVLVLFGLVLGLVLARPFIGPGEVAELRAEVARLQAERQDRNPEHVDVKISPLLVH